MSTFVQLEESSQEMFQTKRERTQVKVVLLGIKWVLSANMHL